jgi:hypothetical protein
LIDDYHLNFAEIKKPEQKQMPQQPASRLTKTFLWLDDLEEATIKVQKQKKPLTSVNVGKELKKPISAPAITDKLRNHQKTIRGLMIDHPERWTLARTEFKPLMNILTTRFPDDGIHRKQA